ncbi:polysaccharide biosynthesis tyrosine autokinase [Actinoplanes sp. NPDC049548]|uniref:polysaccharide biosynthesis tyrosine autokinase n=1 Tax=Actinoplanes sp. NPDC049548 TaxID=3155152 RepID=UPI00341C5011
MTLSSLYKTVRAQWKIVLLSLLIGAAGSGVYSWLQKPTYAASTQIFVSATGVRSNLGDLNQGGTFAQERVHSYVEIVDSPVVARHVIDSLQLPLSPEQLADRVEAKSSADTVLIDITVVDESPTRAHDIAAAIAAFFPQVVNDLETPSGQEKSPVKVSVTKPAVASTDPVSPKITLNVILGVLVGGTIGLAGALVREFMDKTVREAEALAQLTSAPVLCTIPVEAKSNGSPLIIEGSARSPRAEAMRQLRTNLQFVNVDRPLHSLVVTSAMPGEGKSTTTCNLGIAFAEAGNRVLLVDADLRRPKLAEYLDLEGAVGLTNVLAGQVTVGDAIQQWGNTGLWVLTSGSIPPNPSELLASRNMADLLASLTRGFDMVIIDTPPLIPVTDAAVMATVADGCLLVSRHAKTTTAQATAAAGALSTVGARLNGCVLNMTPRRASSTYYYGYTTADGDQPAGDSAQLLTQQTLTPSSPRANKGFTYPPARAAASVPMASQEAARHRRSVLTDAPTTEIRFPRDNRPANDAEARRAYNGQQPVKAVPRR